MAGTFGVQDSEPGSRARARLRSALARPDVEPEIALLARFSDPHGCFLDVGANRGLYSFAALGLFARVIAVEANPQLVPRLRRVLGQAATVLHTALSDAPGQARFWIPTEGERDVDSRGSLLAGANLGFEQRSIEVPVQTLDALGLDDVVLVKIDVEGHELAVLRGGLGVLQTHRPVCIVESEERHHEGAVDALRVLFAGLDYDGYFLHRGRARPVAEFTVAAHQAVSNQKAVGGERNPDYVNNFVFVPREDTTRTALLTAPNLLD